MAAWDCEGGGKVGDEEGRMTYSSGRPKDWVQKQHTSMLFVMTMTRRHDNVCVAGAPRTATQRDENPFPE